MLDGRLHAEDLLALDYRELRGTAVQGLSRFFNVLRVPPEGFSPPKFSTAYDALVDHNAGRSAFTTFAPGDALHVPCEIHDAPAMQPCISPKVVRTDWRQPSPAEQRKIDRALSVFVGEA